MKAGDGACLGRTLDWAHAHPGRHHRRRPGRPAAVPPARGGRASSRSWSRPAAATTSSPASAPASSSTRPSSCSTSAGLGERLQREGDEHRGIYLQWPGERHHLDFVRPGGAQRVGVRADRAAEGPRPRPRRGRAGRCVYDVADTTVHDADSDVRTSRSRSTAVPSGSTRTSSSAATARSARAVTWCRPGRLAAHVPVLVARRARRRRAVDRRADLRVAPGRVRAQLHALGHRHPAVPAGAAGDRHRGRGPTTGSGTRWPTAARPRAGRLDSSRAGPITEKSVLPMRSFVQAPMRHGSVFLAGDAAHIVPPTGAKGLNLAVADVALLAPALVALLREKDSRLADEYSDTALRRVWRCTHFSWWMTTMLHASGGPVRRAAAAVAAALGGEQRGGRDRAGRELRGTADRLLTHPVKRQGWTGRRARRRGAARPGCSSRAARRPG